MDASGPVVYCAKCRTKLDELPTVGVGERSPCPKCGGTNRQFAITLGATVQMTGVVRAGAQVRGVLEVRGDLVRRIEWSEPTEDNPYFLARVFGRNDEVLATDVGDSPDDALLGVIEALLPPSEE